MKMRARGIVTSSVLLLFLALFLVATLAPSGRYRGRSCASNMRQLGLSMEMYASESDGGLYPFLSSEPGRLMWKTRPMYREYSPDPAAYICPSDEDTYGVMYWVIKDGRPRIEPRPGNDREDSIDDWSYFYLGFVVLDDEDVETFAEHYKQRMTEGMSAEGDIPLAKVKEATMLLPASEKKAVRYDRLHQLHDGVETDLLEFDSQLSEHERTVLQSGIPILIERPENHVPSGGNVLYLDGHVEFIPYPGKWPMTEKTIGILNELDAMGDED